MCHIGDARYFYNNDSTGRGAMTSVLADSTTLEIVQILGDT